MSEVAPAGKAVGAALTRADAVAKVTGTAKYSAEWELAGLVHAVIVGSTIAKGRVLEVDTKTASAQPGVLVILSPEKPPKLAIDPAKKQSGTDKVIHVLQTRRVDYQGQPVALVVADTLEHAQHAASLVKVRYQSETPHVDMAALRATAYVPKNMGQGRESASHTGEAGEGGTVSLEQTYVTPWTHHNPMEPHATIAQWEGDRLTVHDATQGVFGTRKRLAALFGIDEKNVRVISKFVGGGFGCKGSSWPHVTLAAIAAREVERPVKIVLHRTQMFHQVGYRPRTEQKLTLTAKPDGELTHIGHDTVSSTSQYDEFYEPCGLVTRMLYASPSIDTLHRLVRLDLNTPTFMRAPGECPGTFALESAMDELSYQLKLDPIALRLKNYAQNDPTEHRPFSSKALKECYQLGAQRFGWSQRNPTPRSMRAGRLLVGLGMASATYPTHRSMAKARAQMDADGNVLVLAGSQDIGTGTYTIMAQIAADTLALPVSRVKFDLGDTLMPETPVSGGSMTAASVGSAVRRACEALRDQLVALAVADPSSSLHGAEAKKVGARNGELLFEGKREPYAAVVKRRSPQGLTAMGEAKPGEETKKFSMHAFGAQFAEVHVDPDLGHVRVTRWVGVYGAGKILNAKTAQSQLYGGVTMGIGMALMEHTVADEKTGRFMTRDLADYHVPVSPDIPTIDITFVPEDDPHINEVGAKGIGEIGITGAAAAIANAVFHATGKRIRELPITPDKLLG